MNETPPNISPCCWLTKKSSRKWQWKWNIIFFFSKLMVPPWASWALKYGCFTKWNNFFILSFIALSVFFVCGVERHLLPFEIGNGQCNKRKTFVYLWLFTGNTETKKNVPTASLLGPSSTDLSVHLDRCNNPLMRISFYSLSILLVEWTAEKGSLKTIKLGACFHLNINLFYTNR